MAEELDTRGKPITDKLDDTVPADAGEKWLQANRRRDGFAVEATEQEVTDENLEARDDRPAA